MQASWTSDYPLCHYPDDYPETYAIQSAFNETPPSVRLDTKVTCNSMEIHDMLSRDIFPWRLTTFRYVVIFNFDLLHKATEISHRLTTFLVQAVNVETLHLSIQYPRSYIPEDPFSLRTSRGILPPIKELRLYNYDWPEDSEHFDLWDLSKLRSVCLNGTQRQYMPFLDQVPQQVLQQLKSFDICSTAPLTSVFSKITPNMRDLLLPISPNMLNLESLTVASPWAEFLNPSCFMNFPRLKELDLVPFYNDIVHTSLKDDSLSLTEPAHLDIIRRFCPHLGTLSIVANVEDDMVG